MTSKIYFNDVRELLWFSNNTSLADLHSNPLPDRDGVYSANGQLFKVVGMEVYQGCLLVEYVGAKK